MAATPLNAAGPGTGARPAALDPVRSALIGAGAGIVGGVVFGLMMSMMSAPTPDGGAMPIIAMVCRIVGSPTVLAGWLYHLFNSAVIGAVFGWLLGGRVSGYGSGAAWGAAYGVVWWVLGGLILMPVLLGLPPFAPLLAPGQLMVAVGSLMGHLLYGVITGAGFRAIAERL
jgi:hypothetical protein